MGSGSKIDYDNKDYYDPPIENFNIPYEYGTDALPKAMTFTNIQSSFPEENFLFTSNNLCPVLEKKLKASANTLT